MIYNQTTSEDECAEKCWFCQNLETGIYACVFFILNAGLLAHFLFNLPSLPDVVEPMKDLNTSLIFSYESLVTYLQLTPYLACQLCFCILVTWITPSWKTELIDLSSLIMVSFYNGFQFTINIILIAFTFFLVGHLSGRRANILLQSLTVGLLGYIQFIPQGELNPVLSSPFTRAALISTVVRLMILGIEVTKQGLFMRKWDFFKASVGFIVHPSLLLSSPFVLFPDWLKVRNQESQFFWTDKNCLSEKPDEAEGQKEKKEIRTELFNRVLSCRRFCMITVHLVFWMTLWYFCFPAPATLVSLMTHPPVNLHDRALTALAGFLSVLHFNIYFIVFFGLCRMFSDVKYFTQILLTLSSDTSYIERTGTNIRRIDDNWRKMSIWNKLLKTEVDVACLVPDGTIFVVITHDVREVLMNFNRGLYDVTEYYIMQPWLNVWNSLYRSPVVLSKKESIPRNFMQNAGKTIGVILSLIFASVFYGFQMGTLIWAVASLLLLFIEQSMKAAELKNKFLQRFSVESQERLRCMGNALLLLLQVASLVFFITNAKLGSLVFRSIFGDVRIFCGTWIYFYCLVSLLTEFDRMPVVENND